MTYFEILVEGDSDEPTIREILTRKFGLEEQTHFRIHAHKGRGKLPNNPLAKPDPKQRALLNQLPAKLCGYAYLGANECVLVVVDADETPPDTLLAELNAMLAQLPNRPKRVMFLLAIEETESWFIADNAAILKAYPKAKVNKLKNIAPDAIVGAWEKLADAVGISRKEVTGSDKRQWALAIAPHLNLEQPYSPSLRKLIEAIGKNI